MALPPESQEKKSAAYASAFWPAFWLGLTLLALKIFYVPLLDDAPDTFGGWARDILILSAADVMFATVCGLAVETLLIFTRQRPKLRRGIWIGFLAVGILSVAYGVAGLRLAQILRMPLTYPLLYLAGDMKSMQSSIAQMAPPKFVAALIAAPILYLVAVLCTRRRAVFGRKNRAVRLLLLAGIAFWYLWSRAQLNGKWGRQEDARGLTVNPHAEFLASLGAAIFGRGAVDLGEDYPPEFVDDFKIAGERAANRPTPGIPRGPKNVIVVIGESICTQQLSLYGSKFKTWPHMEAEAAHSLVFNNFYSHITNTASSLVALTLSNYPPLSWRETTVEQPDIRGTSVAEVLKTHGYRTAFISAGYNDFSNQDLFLKNRGYDVVQDANDTGCEPVSSWGVEDKCMVDQVFKFIDQDRKKPFYVFSWTQGTHHPYEPGPGWEDIDFIGDDTSWGDMDWELNRYLNALHEADKQLERLLEGIRTRGLADDTIVLITGDHGQAFGKPHKSFFHSGRVYEEDVNVPLLIWSPKLFANVPRSEVTGAHVDLSPTVLDLLDLPSPASYQGHSLFAPTRPPRAYFYGAMDSYLLGVRDGSFKYIFNATRGQEEFYDLSKDSDELHNVASEHRAECKLARQRLAAWVEYQKHLPKPGRKN